MYYYDFFTKNLTYKVVKSILKSVDIAHNQLI